MKKTNRLWLLLLILFLVTTIFSGTTLGAREPFEEPFQVKADPEIEAALSQEDFVPVIVSLKGETIALQQKTGGAETREEKLETAVGILKSRAEESEEKIHTIIQECLQGGHMRSYEALWIINGFAAEVDSTALSILSENPHVEKISLDKQVTLSGSRPHEQERVLSPHVPWGLNIIGVPSVWERYSLDGTGVVVANIDSGVDYTHPALSESYRGNHQYSWHDTTDYPYPVPYDPNGHGTHVMGTIVGGPPGEQIGAAPGAKWIAVRAFNTRGDGYNSWIVKAMQWLMAPGGDPTRAPHVVNLSGGSYEYDDIYWEPVKDMMAAGIFVVFSAGNGGPDSGTITYPAVYPNTLAVGATRLENRSEMLWRESSVGPAYWRGTSYIKPDLVAPGANVYSSLPENRYGVYSGTSMAAPHVAGTAALMLQAYPDLSVEQTMNILKKSAFYSSSWPSTKPNNLYGHGSVDALGAVEMVRHQGTPTFVSRFYQYCLGRAPDPEGLEYWKMQLVSGNITGAQAAYGFIFSTEFINRGVSDQEYITILYRSFFDREPDAPGYKNWIDHLNSGKNRLFVLSGFIDSPEFIDLCSRYGITPGVIPRPELMHP